MNKFLINCKNPYYHTAQDTPDKLDYESMARVVTGLAKTIAALAGGAQG
jgi:hypothetical protein